MATEIKKVKNLHIKNQLKLKIQSIIFDAQSEDTNTQLSERNQFQQSTPNAGNQLINPFNYVTDEMDSHMTQYRMLNM